MATLCLTSWEGLLNEARAGSRRALGVLLQAQRPLLLRLSRIRLGTSLSPKASADDLVQDTYADALSGFADFRGASPEEFRGWMKAVLRHNLTDLARRFRATTKRRLASERPLDGSNFQLPDPNPGPADLAEQHEELDLLRCAVEHLPAAERELIRLHLEENLTLAELGRLVGCSKGAMRQRWARVLAHCRRELGAEDGT